MEKKKEFIINVMFWALIGAVVLAFFKFLFPALIPFVIAFVVAYIIRFLARKIGGKSQSARKTVALLLTLCFYLIIFSLIISMGLKVVDEVGSFIRSIPTLYNESIIPFLNIVSQTILEVAKQFDERVALEVQNTFVEFQTGMGKYISNFSLALVSLISDGIIGIPSLLIKLIVTVVATFFLAIDFDKMTELLCRVVGQKRYDIIYESAHHAKTVITAYLKSYTLLFCLTFAELSIGLWILKIPYPVLIAILIAIFDILPILGTGGVLIPWSIICLFIGKTPLGIGIFILYIIITAIRNTLEPKIVGKQIGMHPLVTLMAMFVGMNVMGLIGLFLFPITLVIIVNMVKAGIVNIGDSQSTSKTTKTE